MSTGSENNCTTSVLSIYTHSSSPPENVKISLPEKLKPVRTATVNLKGDESRESQMANMTKACSGFYGLK